MGRSAAPVPSITGVTVVGNKLTANAAFSPSAEYAYQWVRESTNIQGAVAPTYTLATADIGARISVNVTGSKTGYITTTRGSDYTSIITSGIIVNPPPPEGGAVQRPVRPVPGPSYTGKLGPIGKHYPDNLHWVGYKARHEIKCDPSLAAINAASQTITDQMNAEGAVIRVRTGMGPIKDGLGASSGRKSPLDGAGKASWTKPVAVVPDGPLGSVAITASFSGQNVHNLAFVGWDGRTVSAVLTDSYDSYFVWCRFRSCNANRDIDNVWQYEVVTGGFRPWQEGVGDTDGWAYRPADKADGTVGPIKNVGRVGCHALPIWKLMNNTGHIDAGQFERSANTKTAAYGNLTLDFCVDWAHANQTYLFAGSKGGGIVSVDGKPGVLMRNCLGVSGDRATTYFPRYRQDDTYKDHDYSQINQVKPLASPTLFQGSAADVDTYDCDFIGSYGGIKYRNVARSRRDKAPVLASSRPSNGEWTVDSKLLTVGEAYFRDRAPEPTWDYLKSIWVW